MKQPLFFPLCCCLIAIVHLEGCARKSPLADRIAGANQVIVLRRTGAHQAASRSITGDEATAIVRAAVSATLNPQKGGAAPAFDDDIKIMFLNGSNVLSVVLANQGRFATDGNEYMDESGILRQLGTASADKWHATSYEQYQQLK